MPQASPRFLFVGGSARSGTTVLTQLLNEHLDMIIGIERYSRLWNGQELTPDHFQKDTFLSTDGEDLKHPKFGMMAGFDFESRFGTARFIGDKYPFILSFQDFIFERFENATILAIFRNPLSVCESHQRRNDDPDDGFNIDAKAALPLWNKGISLFFEALNKGYDVSCVSYERLFSSNDSMKRLLGYFDLNPKLVKDTVLDSYSEHYRKLSDAQAQRNEDIRWDVAQRADFDGYRKLMDEFCILRPQANAESALPRLKKSPVEGSFA